MTHPCVKYSFKYGKENLDLDAKSRFQQIGFYVVTLCHNKMLEDCSTKTPLCLYANIQQERVLNSKKMYEMGMTGRTLNFPLKEKMCQLTLHHEK